MKNIHTINPSNYQYVAVWTTNFQGMDDCKFIQYERDICKAHQNRTHGRLVLHSSGFCTVCGNALVIYLLLFYRAKTNEYIVVGTDCAEKLNLLFDKLHLKAFKRKVHNAREKMWELECFMKTIAWG